MRRFLRNTTSKYVLPSTHQPVTLESVKEAAINPTVNSPIILVAKYAGGYKGHPSFTYNVPGYNLYFKLKTGSQEIYLSNGTLDSYNRLQNSKTYSFGCGGCGKRCTVTFPSYPMGPDGIPDASKPELLI